MKILKIGGILCLIAATVFFGFQFFFGGQAVQDPTGDFENQQENEELAYYRERAEVLEDELTKLKQEQYTTTQQYEERISELELLLRAEEDEPTPPPTTVTYTYTVTGDQITITGYSGEETSISIPSSIDGLAVVAIGREAFRESALTEVVIPDSVKHVDWFAFYGSASLTRVTIPTSVTKIEYGVFDGCDHLTVQCERNSYADKYARSYGMSVSN